MQEKVYTEADLLTRISQHEMAFRMQISVPEVMDVSKEPQFILDMYGVKPGERTFAMNCLLARKLDGNEVRFVQLFDCGWDGHGTTASDNVKGGLRNKCRWQKRIYPRRNRRIGLLWCKRSCSCT